MEDSQKTEVRTTPRHPANIVDEVLFKVYGAFGDKPKTQEQVRGAAIQLWATSIGNKRYATGEAEMRPNPDGSITIPTLQVITSALESLPVEEARQVIEAILRELGVTQTLKEIEESRKSDEPEGLMPGGNIEVALDGSGTLTRKDDSGSRRYPKGAARLILSKLQQNGSPETWRLGIEMDPKALEKNLDIPIAPSKFLTAPTNAPEV